MSTTGGTDGGADVERPTVPHGRHVWLEGRGRTFVRQLAGPAGAPTLVLLHGWTATADLNWWASYGPLAAHFNVVALDHRGHGRGIRSPEPFRLEQCADDVAALAAALGLERIIPVGYSMGGPVAQLLWRRHRHLVAGLVLCATSASFRDSRRERVLSGVATGTSLLAGALPLGRLTSAALGKWTGLARPPRVGVVGLRGGRPPRLGADPGGRAGGPAVRLAPVDRRRGRAHRGRRDRRRRRRADLTPVGAGVRHPRRRQLARQRRARRVHHGAGAVRAGAASPHAVGRPARCPASAIAVAA